MFEWIRTHFALSTQKFLDIGDSEQSTELLIAEHREFEKAANVYLKFKFFSNVAF